jgi:hypothetical protein
VEKGLFWDIELTPEDVEAVIQDTAKKIAEYQMETIAILTLESLKPWSFVGGELTRAALAPLMPALGHDLGLTSEKLLQVFEDRKNIEHLIQILESNVKKQEADRKQKQKEAKQKKLEKKQLDETVKTALDEAGKKNRKDESGSIQ